MTASNIQRRRIHNMKIFASALMGLSLMLGTVMAAQAPATSSSNTSNADTTKSTTKVKKHKKHHAKTDTTAPATNSDTAKPSTTAPANK